VILRKTLAWAAALGLVVIVARTWAQAERKGLDTTRGVAMAAASPAYSSVPLTFECFVRLTGRAEYNIIVANESKASPTHWELFTTPGDGLLAAYLPGRRPDHAWTDVNLTDGQWHYLAMVLEKEQVRLFVDGAMRAKVALSPPPDKGIPGPLAFGALTTLELRCKGFIAEARISNTAREITGVPDRLDVDQHTVGLWRFDQLVDGVFPDLSPLANAAEYRRMRLGPGHIPVAGGMSAEFQPLPPPEDVTALRRALREIAAHLNLQTVRADRIRDGVLREWNFDYTWYGRLEYPEWRGVWWQEPGALERQVFDRHALIWPEDGGPVGTVLRRTGALIQNLRRHGAGSAIGQYVADWRRLKEAYQAEKPAPDTSAYKAYYLAACALRRNIALSNPLLNFDQILFVARGTFAGSVRSNPATADVQGGHFATQFFGFNALPGGGLFLVRNFKDTPQVINVLGNSVVENGRLKGRKLDYGAFCTPDLSCDGRTIVFAWTENSAHRWIWSKKTTWHLFKVNVDGTGLRQLTDGPYNDFDPCWLPDGRIAFISDRRGGHIRCFAAYLKVRQYTLFSMKDDGTDLVPLSYFETSEWNPSVNNEGQLVYTRWDYVDRENCLGTRIWISGPDGTDPRAPHGNYPHPYHTFPDHEPWGFFPDGRERDSRLGTPLVEMGIRAVPNSHLYIFTAAPHHGEVFGSLCMLDLRLPDDGHMAQIKRITPDESFPETETPGRRHYKYGTPWPLSEDYYLCNVWENLALVDRYGNKELLCELRLLPCPQDERLRLVDPIPVRPRPKPPIIPPRTYQGERADPSRRATLAVVNVYASDLPFPQDTKIKWLRVVQNILKSNHAMGEPMIGYERENTPRIPLGIVPVEEDGSAYFEAPVAKELIFQVLDENYMAVQSMRSVAFVHPGEQLTCEGCHEPKHKAPAIRHVPLAFQRPPSPIQPEIGPVEPISYYRQIKPIFDKTCVPCHVSSGRGPRDMSYEALREDAFWFSGAMFLDMCSAYSGVHGGSRTIPGRFGARYCRLGRALMDPLHRKAVAEDERHKIIVWLDCNSLRLGAYHDEAAQLRGELVWPELDVDPANILGIEGRGAPLRRNFWHENLYGPHAFLAASISRQSLLIVDETGNIVWEYPAEGARDVWMLPNGHILATYRHGVREVTREKRLVWEFRVEAPDQVASCQPLAGGIVLVGIAGRCRLVEVNRKGEILCEVPLSTTEEDPELQLGLCRKTPQGTYLVPFTGEGALREYDTAGKIIREFPREPMPMCAVRLLDGNTLVTAGGMVTEYDREDRVMWELTQDDVPDISLGVLAGVQRLANGNTIICNLGTKNDADREAAHVFEVTPDKRVVWQVTDNGVGRVVHCQLLASDLMLRPDEAAR